MKDRFTILKILSGLIFGGCIVLFALAVILSGGFEPPIFVLFALAFFIMGGILAHVFIDHAKNSHSIARDLKDILEVLKRDK